MKNYCMKAERVTEKITDEEMHIFDCFPMCSDCTYFIAICENEAEKAQILNNREKRMCPACGMMCEVHELDDNEYTDYIKCENCGTIGAYPRGEFYRW